jgi:hypothetical protein
MLGRNPEDDPPETCSRGRAYIGSITPVPSRWTFDTDTKGMVKRDISYVPGPLKHLRRDPSERDVSTRRADLTRPCQEYPHPGGRRRRHHSVNDGDGLPTG